MNPDPDRYFSDYENLEIHDLMLKDRPRQEAYCEAIMNNAELFKDKVVIDVGAGTGILSAFCAKAGAKMVLAVEASQSAKIALEIMQENNLSSVVKVIPFKIEDFELPESLEKADIIVSEWMGFYLLHEGMLDSLIHARDRLLKPDGLMFPQEAMIYVSPCSVPSLYRYYENVDGIKMTAFASKLRAQKSSKPEICIIEEENLRCEGTVMHYMNLKDVSLDQIEEIVFPHTTVVDRSGRFEGFCIWFDVRFPSVNFEDAVYLRTGPGSPATHWKQCVVVLPEGSCLDVEKGEPLSYVITMKRNPQNVRRYNLEVEMMDPESVEHSLPCDCHLTKCILLKAHLEKVNGAGITMDGL